MSTPICEKKGDKVSFAGSSNESKFAKVFVDRLRGRIGRSTEKTGLGE